MLLKTFFPPLNCGLWNTLVISKLSLHCLLYKQKIFTLCVIIQKCFGGHHSYLKVTLGSMSKIRKHNFCWHQQKAQGSKTKCYLLHFNWPRGVSILRSRHGHSYTDDDGPIYCMRLAWTKVGICIQTAACWVPCTERFQVLRRPEMLRCHSRDPPGLFLSVGFLLTLDEVILSMNLRLISNSHRKFYCLLIRLPCDGVYGMKKLIFNPADPFLSKIAYLRNTYWCILII